MRLNEERAERGESEFANPRNHLPVVYVKWMQVTASSALRLLCVLFSR